MDHIVHDAKKEVQGQGYQSKSSHLLRFHNNLYSKPLDHPQHNKNNPALRMIQS